MQRHSDLAGVTQGSREHPIRAGGQVEANWRWPRVRRMDQPIAYARRILVNLAIDDGERRSRRRRELEPPEGAPLGAHADEAATRAFAALDARAELLGALAVLPPRQRAVLVLRYFEDLSEAQ